MTEFLISARREIFSYLFFAALIASTFLF